MWISLGVVSILYKGLFLELVYRMPVNGDILFYFIIVYFFWGGGVWRGGVEKNLSLFSCFVCVGALYIHDNFGVGLSLRIKKNESTTPSLEVNG